MDTGNNLPFKPIRDLLYSGDELWQGFQKDDPRTFQTTPDFQCYKYFVMNGRATTVDQCAGMMEALHDNSMLRALNSFVRNQKKVVAIMGGHDLERNSTEYRIIVELAKLLAEKKFLLVSGGGPGAMEATHLGVLLKDANSDDVSKAIATISKEIALPRGASGLVDKDGVVNSEIADALHRWAVPAHTVLNDLRNSKVSVQSLAIPTWHYGHEPVTPLATNIAKFFQNSIREDVLLLVPRQGIVYAPGSAGTLQEVFQDTAQNYYSLPGECSPFVLFDINKSWSEILPVTPLLKALFVKGKKLELYNKYYSIASSLNDVVAELEKHLSTTGDPGKSLSARGFV